MGPWADWQHRGAQRPCAPRASSVLGALAAALAALLLAAAPRGLARRLLAAIDRWVRAAALLADMDPILWASVLAPSLIPRPANLRPPALAFVIALGRGRVLGFWGELPGAAALLLSWWSFLVVDSPFYSVNCCEGRTGARIVP